MTIIDLSNGLHLEDSRVARAIADDEDFASMIIESSVDGIVASNSAGYYTIWNPTMERITGLRKEQVLGRHWADFFPMFKGTPVEDALSECLKGKTVELPPIPWRKPGTDIERFTQQKNMPIFNEKNEVVGALVVVRDVTESKKTLDSLIEENRALKERLSTQFSPNE